MTHQSSPIYRMINPCSCLMHQAWYFIILVQAWLVILDQGWHFTVTLIAVVLIKSPLSKHQLLYSRLAVHQHFLFDFVFHTAYTASPLFGLTLMVWYINVNLAGRLRLPKSWRKKMALPAKIRYISGTYKTWIGSQDRIGSKMNQFQKELLIMNYEWIFIFNQS